MHPKKLYRLFFTFYTLLLCLTGTAQLENSKWYFGHFGGLDFATEPPTIPVFRAMTSAEACAAVCDAQGKLLFYTNGMTVWIDKNKIMTNGTGLAGHESSSQGALIVKQPGTSSIYFIFTIDWAFGAGGWQYSVVDISQEAGAGAVVLKNVPIYAPVTEKMTATPHCNGTDTWVVAHDSTNQFLAVLVSAAGVNTVPVVSSAGLNYGNYGYQGNLRFRPDGQQLASAGRGYDSVYPWLSGGFELFDFDNATGVVSNGVILAKGHEGFETAYSCEYSASGRYLYGTSAAGVSPKLIWQWDLCAENINSVRNSRFTVANYSATAGIPCGLARTPNDRIYVSNPYSKYLGVINSPDSAENACHFSEQGYYVTYGYPLAGLPGTIYPNKKYDFEVSASCQTATFSVGKMYTSGCMQAPPISAMQWNFGDPASGGSNISTLENPVHNFGSAGLYTIQLIIQYKCTSDTIFKTIEVSECTDVTEFSENSKFRVFPNPVQELLTIEIDEPMIARLRDVYGRVVTEKQFPAGVHYLDIKTEEPGFYTMQLSNNKKAHFIKIVKL